MHSLGMSSDSSDALRHERHVTKPDVDFNQMRFIKTHKSPTVMQKSANYQVSI